MPTRIQKPRLAFQNRLNARGGIVREDSRRRCGECAGNCRPKRDRQRRRCHRLGSISQDPIGFAAGDVNQYRYVANGPTNATDPSGLFDILGPTRTRPEEFYEWSKEDQLKWIRARWDQYGKFIKAAAVKHNVPEHLLTLVVFNEMMDYSLWEQLGEEMGFGSSCGPAQLTIHALVAHGISPESARGNHPPIRIENSADAGIAMHQLRDYYRRFRHALKDPEQNIDLLAQLVKAYIAVLRERTNTADGSWGLSDRVVTQVIRMPLNLAYADQFRGELRQCDRPDYRPSASLMGVVQGMVNDTETVLEESHVNENVLAHISNAWGLHPFIDKDDHKW
jgi:hypothetical protein